MGMAELDAIKFHNARTRAEEHVVFKCSLCNGPLPVLLNLLLLFCYKNCHCFSTTVTVINFTSKDLDWVLLYRTIMWRLCSDKHILLGIKTLLGLQKCIDHWYCPSDLHPRIKGIATGTLLYKYLILYRVLDKCEWKNRQNNSETIRALYF